MALRQTNQEGLELTTRHEGVRLKAYRDTGGVWTIGYGHTKDVKAGMEITQATALAFLKSDLAFAESWVERLVKVPLTDNQFAALVDFVFNLGPGALQRSTLLKKLNAGDYEGAAKEFLRWNKDNGKVLAGLTRRCADRQALFMKGYSK